MFRRSRSAVTPQKDDPANQGDENKVVAAKANLETVFEKDNNSGEEVGASADFGDSEEAQADMEANSAEANDVAPGESNTEANEKSSESALSPKKADGTIELNCQVCNCSFTNYHEHMNSDGHKSKMTPNKMEGQANAAAGQAQKRNSENEGGPAAKRMKNQPNAQNTSTEKFNCDVCKLTLTKQQDYECHMNGKRHLMNVNKAQGKSYCEICKLFFNSVTDLNDHTESQLHKNTVADKKQDKQTFECSVCKVTSIGQRQHEQHLSSKRHKKSLEQPAGNAKDNSAPKAVPSAVNGKAESAPAAAPGLKKWIYFCGACRYGCNQDQLFSSHMNLAEHKAAVTEMRKKGLVQDKESAKSAAAKAAKPAGAKPTASNIANQNARKVPQNSSAAAQRGNAGAPGAANKPNFIRNANASGPVTKVTYNIVPGPNMNANAAAAGKSAPVKKGPVVGQVGPGGPKKNVAMNMNKPNMAANKAPMGGRPNPRFAGQQGESQGNKFNQPMKMAPQAGGNFGPAYGGPMEGNNVGGNYGNYAARPAGNYGGAMRNNMGPTPDMRNDFRGNMREDYRGDLRDIRDIRDIRNVDLGVDNRGDGNFRSGFYRDVSGEAGRETRTDYGNSFRGNDMNMDARADIRSSVGSDMRGMARNDMVRELGADLRGYNNDIRDIRSDARNDYRGSAAGYGGSGGFPQQNYRSNEDFRSDAYGRGVQASGQSTASGSYSSGIMASGRYDSYMDRNSSGYSNQYASSSRGIGYIGDMALNGR